MKRNPGDGRNGTHSLRLGHRVIDSVGFVSA